MSEAVQFRLRLRSANVYKKKEGLQGAPIASEYD